MGDTEPLTAEQQKAYEESVRRLSRIFRPLMDANDASERITAEDLAIVVNT